MLVTGVEEIQNPTNLIKEPSLLRLLFLTVLSICTMAGIFALVFHGIRKVIDSYTIRKKRLAARHPYYYSLISG
jgi:hypothetical protein